MSIRSLTPKFLARDIVFGEGLRWHDSRVWLSDMLGRKVYAFDEQGAVETVAEVPGRPNGLGFLPDGTLIVSSMEDGCLYRVESSGKLVLHADLSPLMTGYIGDMAIDSKGRAYVDDVGYRVFEGAPVSPGRLLLVEPDGHASVQDEPLSFPNGMWITQDKEHLFFAEGRVGRLFKYDFGSHGELINKQLIVEYPGKPFDGLTIDGEGGIWICQPYEKRVIRLVDAQITHQVLFDDVKPVSVCLGGADFKTLYVVAADYTLERMATNDCWAALYTVGVATAGFPLIDPPARFTLEER